MLAHALTLNKELSQEEADVLAHVAVKELARQLIAAAEALNLKVTIDLAMNEPLTTGDTKHRVDIRRKRILNDKGAYALPEVKDVKQVLNSVFGPQTLAHVLFDAQQELKKHQQ